MSDAELRAQHALVIEISQRVRAVLPVRFGSLLEKGELHALIRRHHAEIAAALAHVRDRVQMTVRVLGGTPAPASPRVSSGREYLERARRAATLPVPEPAQQFLSALQPCIVQERRQPGAGELLATVYHLVEAEQVPRYVKAAAAPGPGIMVSGPWPPFAFSPQLW